MISCDSKKSPAGNIFGMALAVVVGVVVCRVMSPSFLGHASNFSPMNAIALFSGAYFANRLFAFALPILALLVSDVFVNLMLLGTANPFYPGWIWQALSYVVIVGLGTLLGRKITAPRIIGSSLGTSLLFFFVSNFGVWLSTGMYPLTGAGLGLCFVAAIPFFGGTLLSDLFYSSVMFGSLELTKSRYAERPSLIQVT